MNKPGHTNNPLDPAVWAELNNFSGMQNIIINFYSIIDFHFKFCQVNRGISNYIENYSELPPSAGEGRGSFFLTVSAVVSSQIIF